MLVVLLCCMMKLVEFSTGKPVVCPQNNGRPRKRYRRRQRGKAMNEVGLAIRGSVHSPDSDCNSNHRESVNCLSNTSSQDIDFIQDNSDYQWFLDYGYREGGTNHHTSILSLPETYDAGDIKYYDVLSKNMDANLAEVDIESFRTEDIHALLTTLPPMCTDHFSQENNRQGESCASMSGSIMAKFDFDSPHSSSQGDESANSNSMSICKSELLFSPVKETPMPGANFSVDSLDCDLLTEHDIMLTCQANKDNYTIAFEGSMTMYSEDSDYHETDKSETSGAGSTHWPNALKTQVHNLKNLETSMSQSDSGSFTTWSKLKKRSSDNQLRRHPSGNNNQSGDETSQFNLMDNVLKSQSMPNLHKQKVKGSLNNNYTNKQSSSTNSSETCTVKRIPVKVFDIQHQIQSSSGSGASVVSDMATSLDAGSSASDNGSNKHPNFSLVKLYMKQKSMSAEGMSVGLDQSSASENWPASQSGESGTSEPKNSDHRGLLEINDRKMNTSNSQIHERIIEEQEEEGHRLVEQFSESISKVDSIECSTDNDQYVKPPMFNVNNNNSIGHEESPRRIQRVRKKSTRNCIPLHLINKSMQTSHLTEMSSMKHSSLKSSTNPKDAFKVVEPSFLSKLKKEGEIKQPVYVLYPSYALPNLDFLKEKEENPTKVYLIPQKAPHTQFSEKKRPFSCNDIEALKQKGFSHIQDWDSLNFLLPWEYRQILAGVPEIAQHLTVKDKLKKQRRRPLSSDYTGILERTQSLDRATNVSSSSSTGTQPSSGYRGSSTMLLTDSQNSPATATNLNPLFVYRYDSVTSSEASLMASERQRSITTMAPPLPKRSISISHDQSNITDLVPPRPPLPKGILRRTIENSRLRKNDPSNKRYSMIIGNQEVNDEMTHKRRSLQEPYYLQRNKRLSETEDEGVDAGTSSSSLDDHADGLEAPTPPPDMNVNFLSHISNEELAQLEEFLKISGISTSDHEELDDNSIMQLRSYVSRFLALKINQEGAEHFGGKKNVSFAEKVNVLAKQVEPKLFIAPNNSPNVSAAFVSQRNHQTKTLVDMPICEESESSPEHCASPQRMSSLHNKTSDDLVQKRALISAVTDAVEQLIHHFSPATNQTELNELGDSSLNPACAKLALSALCPALYAVLCDGLKPNLETSFGAIPNSVWQVVETSSQQGPLTKSLHELVMRINGEDVITEGLVKFNAFVFGLLNVRSLDAWASYLRTRESILRKHYNPDSLLLMSHTGGAKVRSLVDTLIAALQPLALLPFQFDLLFEYRELHMSLKRMDSYQQLLSPTKLSTSPNFSRQWNTKLGLSSNSNRSNSDIEEVSVATTVRHYPTNTKDSESGMHKTRSTEQRPKSCLELSKPNFKLNEDVTCYAKKRWSGISSSNRLHQVYDRLACEEEEYVDSLEATVQNTNQSADEERSSNQNVPVLSEDGPESLDSNLADDKPVKGRRFKKLQKKWEMLSGQEPTPTSHPTPQSPPGSPTHTGKSKIPRPLTSPVKPSGIPVPVSVKKAAAPTNAASKKITNGFSKTANASNLVRINTPKRGGQSTRTSRVDQVDGETPRHPTRPSSLPYKPNSSQNTAAKLIPPRRAVSSSLSRKQTSKPTPKTVRTVSHRLPSESGHLSFNEGERLRVMLEVDEKWLLCCRGNQKGLVSRSAVIVENDRF